MRGRVSLASALLVVAALTAACGGNPPPEQIDTEPTPAPTDTATAVDVDREAEADRLCERARAALEAGNYETARELYREVQRDYPGTRCAEAAEGEVERVDAIEAIRARVHFEFDRSRITDEAAEVLRRKAEALQRYPDVQLTVEGHCDERGSLEYNQALGMRRAESTRRFLVSLGLSGERFRTVSYGEEQPLVEASNERAWAMNRRAEFVMTEMGRLGEP